MLNKFFGKKQSMRSVEESGSPVQEALRRTDYEYDDDFFTDYVEGLSSEELDQLGFETLQRSIMLLRMLGQFGESTDDLVFYISYAVHNLPELLNPKERVPEGWANEKRLRSELESVLYDLYKICRHLDELNGRCVNRSFFYVREFQVFFEGMFQKKELIHDKK